MIITTHDILNANNISYYLNKGPRTNESQMVIPTDEPIVVSVEQKVVQIEKPGTET